MSPDPTHEMTISAAAGVAAVVVATLGVHPQEVMWGMVGSVVGASFAPPASRWRAVAVFIATTLACALFGEWLAVEFLGGGMLARNGSACGLAIVFHPLLTIIVQRLPVLADALAGRIGGKP